MNNRIRILVVDGEPKICHLIEELLKLEGYRVDVSFSGMEALQMIKENKYQMLLTDLKMPGIGGLELIQKAKELNPEIRTIMMTGYATAETAVQSLRHGVDDYIKEPVNIFELKEIVKQSLYTRQVAMENVQLVKDLQKANREMNIHKHGLAKKVQITGEHLAVANKELVQRINELATINEISRAITSVLDMDELLSLCLKEINEKLKIKHSSIMFVNEKGDGLIVKACHGHRSRQVLGKTQKIDEGVAGRVVTEGKPVLVKDIRRDDRFNKSERPIYETKSFVSAPLIAEGRVFGVINIIDKDSGENFCEADANLLCTIAGQVSIAVENARLYEALEGNCFNMIRSLAASLEAKDRYTSGHSHRVSEYSTAIANIMGVPDKGKETLRYAALLHDIGKIGISEHILNKAGKLDDSEFNIIKSHPSTGERIMKPLFFLDDAIHHVRGHHESFDGGGYPDGLGGEDLSLLTRIMTVADSFDAMTSERTYRPLMNTSKAVSELKRVAGKQFCPEVVDAFASCEIIKIKSDLEAGA